MRHAKIVVVALAVLVWTATLAVAEEHEGHHEDGGRDGSRWHGEIGRFHEHDIQIWRGGHWHHGRHNGRMGWWWLVGGIWYLYPYPVYPYPDPYQPPAYLQSPASPGYWYYCADPAGYYPYVAQCYDNWQRVPASPPPPPGPYLLLPP